MAETENPRVDLEAWTLVASGYIGDVISWKPGFEALGEAQHILSQLENLGGRKAIDWVALIADNHYFAGIELADFPPLYNEKDFEFIFDDFLALVHEHDDDEIPSQTFSWLDLYIDTDRRDSVVQNFTRFCEHLRRLNFLQDAGIL
jgi:hypothetical protein